jgi:2-polyprenyl-3-methyl-5-hydroxy-6-metoxy-1,4-benzoquinol methylase
MQSTNDKSEEGRIRAAPSPRCILCGNEGKHVYLEQRDRLFGAEGSWNLKQCPDRECGLIWLDPMPLPEDIGKAYAHYYTHASRDGVSQSGFLKRVYKPIMQGYFAHKYHYPAGSRPSLRKMLGCLLYLFPVRRRGLDGDVRFLKALPQGRVLDIGCGSGDWLALMKDLGWRVSGLDFDENAVKVARVRGLEVACGALGEQDYPDDIFDAVTLSHVIEHVPDPIETLAECLRILKPGGILVVLTPNASSFSHGLFKQDWRGLEPPRHLHIFSNQSLAILAARAGFKNVTIRPHMAGSVMYESIFLRRGSTHSTAGRPRNRAVEFLARLLTLLEYCMLKWDSSAADCVAAVAIK